MLVISTHKQSVGISARSWLDAAIMWVDDSDVMKYVVLIEANSKELIKATTC